MRQRINPKNDKTLTKYKNDYIYFNLNMKNYGELKDTSKEYITKIINNNYIYIYIYIYSYYLIKY